MVLFKPVCRLKKVQGKKKRDAAIREETERKARLQREQEEEEESTDVQVATIVELGADDEEYTADLLAHKDADVIF